MVYFQVGVIDEILRSCEVLLIRLDVQSFSLISVKSPIRNVKYFNYKYYFNWSFSQKFFLNMQFSNRTSWNWFAFCTAMKKSNFDMKCVLQWFCLIFIRFVFMCIRTYIILNQRKVSGLCQMVMAPTSIIKGIISLVCWITITRKVVGNTQIFYILTL